MERVRLRHNSSGFRPADYSATPLMEADPSIPSTNTRESDAEDAPWYPPPPSTANPQHADKSRFSRFKPARQKPLFRGFERPNFIRIAILTVLCLVAYPAFYALTLVAKDKSLFIVRLIVSVWCSVVGFALGYVVLMIAAQHLEAATWATVIHTSNEGGGMKPRDLARSSRNPPSFMAAFHILRSRFRNRKTARGSHKSHDNRPWSLFLVFFIALAILAPLLALLFGRIMVIETFIGNQHRAYREVLIAGDLSTEDEGRAIAHNGKYTGFPQTWAEVASSGITSKTAEFVYGNDTVYFAQPSRSQFAPGGSGAGTFSINQAVVIAEKEPLKNAPALAGKDAPKSNANAVLRYPQWGIRIHCEKLPNPETNLVPYSSAGYTYTFIPQDFLRGLFGVYGMDLPTQFTKPDLTLQDNDTIPSNIDPSTISYVESEGLNGQSITFNTTIPHATSSQGWTTIEHVLMRIDTNFTPSGRFPVYWDGPSPQRRIGLDVAICVQKYEPWIIEVHNTSTGSPSALRIVEKGDGSTSPLPSGNIQGSPIANTRYLNTTGKDAAFSLAHINSYFRTFQIEFTPNETWFNFTPPPLAVYLAEGDGPLGYVELSPDRFAAIRARVGALNALPYFAGSGPVVAQLYEDETLARTTFEWWQLVSLLLLILFLGTIGELFVPTLPFDVPRREFGLYSWLALFQAQELQSEADNFEKFMSLDELEEKYSNKRVEFVVGPGEGEA